ncbi:MAG: maleylacetoacetate isomerase [Candidatus Binatia bacterium]
MELYTYFRSSASFRVRIALNLKGIDYEPHFVHLVRDGGEQKRSEYLRLNPQGLVPALVHDSQLVTQSLAILEYLDELYPHPPILPKTAQDRAYVRSLAQLIACEIHPLNNLRVLNYLKDTLMQSEELRLNWYRHWIHEGFQALEARLAKDPRTGTHCHGDSPTVADICLVPQVFNAKRFDCSLNGYPTIQRIHESCMKLTAFQAAAPQNQGDAE